jgi:hypothetical protein
VSLKTVSIKQRISVLLNLISSQNTLETMNDLMETMKVLSNVFSTQSMIANSKAPRAPLATSCRYRNVEKYFRLEPETSRLQRLLLQ